MAEEHAWYEYVRGFLNDLGAGVINMFAPDAAEAMRKTNDALRRSGNLEQYISSMKKIQEGLKDSDSQYNRLTDIIDKAEELRNKVQSAVGSNNSSSYKRILAKDANDLEERITEKKAERRSLSDRNQALTDASNLAYTRFSEGSQTKGELSKLLGADQYYDRVLQNAIDERIGTNNESTQQTK